MGLLDFFGGEGIASLISSGIGAITTGVENKKDRAWNAEQAELNRQFNSEEAALSREFQTSEREAAQDWNLAQWNRENEYNAPTAQMDRMVAAGINPNVAAQAIGGNATAPGSVRTSGQSGAQASSSAATSNVNPAAIGNILGNSVNNALSARNLGADAQGKDIDNAWKDKRYAKELERTDKEIQGIIADIGLKGEQAELAKKTAWSIAQKTPKEIEAIEAGLTKIAAEIEMMDKQKEKIDSDIAVNNADISLKGAQEMTEDFKQINIAASTEETIVRTQLADMGFGLSETQFMMRFILNSIDDGGATMASMREGGASEEEINEYASDRVRYMQDNMQRFWEIVDMYSRINAQVQAELYEHNRGVDSRQSYEDRVNNPWSWAEDTARSAGQWMRDIWERGLNAF